jgi:alpha-tubulin suppressor-like RCC1 family protein
VNPESFVSVAVGGDHLCAIRSDGRAFCWGFGERGQLGSGKIEGFLAAPVEVVGLPAATAISAGGEFTCALTAAGGVYCWGNDEYGQVGDGVADINASRPAPFAVPLPSAAVAVTAGGYHFGGGHSCALLASGAVYCWGADQAGQIGDGKSGFNVFSTAPFVVAGLPPIQAIAAGGMHTCALAADGRVFCWGDDAAGQIGDGHEGNGFHTLVPFAVGLPGPALSIAAGERQTCAVIEGGQLRCWGEGSFGLFGQLTGGNVTTPQPSWGGVEVASIELGAVHACAIVAGGQVECAGLDDLGEVGSGKPGPFEIHATPVPIALGEGATRIEAGTSVSCALLASAKLECWGDWLGPVPVAMVAP